MRFRFLNTPIKFFHMLISLSNSRGDFFNKNKTLFLILTFVFVVFSFINTQLTGDFMEFWSYGRLVKNSDSIGLTALIDCWSIKGLLFRAFVYLEYLLTSFFINDYSRLCQSLYKIIGLFFYFLILLATIYVYPANRSIKKSMIFLVSSIMLLSVHFASHFQPEFLCVVLLLFSTALYLREKIPSIVIASIVYSAIFFLKPTFALMGGALFFSSLLVTNQNFVKGLKNILPFCGISALFLISSLLLLYKVFPQEITDLWDASYYQPTLFHQNNIFLGPIKNFIISFISKGIIYNPAIAIGILSTIALFINWYPHNYKKIIYLALLWIFPSIHVIISNCFFVYHYYLFLFPSIISLFVLYKDCFSENQNKELIIGRSIKFNRILCVIALLFISYYLVFLSSISSVNRFLNQNYDQTMTKLYEEKNITIGLTKLDTDKVLFLDDSRGAWLFNNKSYLRYFYPLPLQRIKKDDLFTHSETYKQTLKKALEYNGKYIVIYEDWFFGNNNNMELKNKVEKEYKLKEVVITPTQPWNLTKKNLVTTIPVSIYVKK